MPFKQCSWNILPVCPSVPRMIGVIKTLKQTVKQIVPIDMNTEIPKLKLFVYFVAITAFGGRFAVYYANYVS